MSVGVAVLAGIGGFWLSSRESVSVNLSSSVVADQSPVPTVGEDPAHDEIPGEAPENSSPRADQLSGISEKTAIPEKASETKESQILVSNQWDSTDRGTEAKPIKTDLVVKDRLFTGGFAVSAGPRSVDTVVIHSSYNSLGGDEFAIGKIIDIYKSYGVSAHYLVGRDGTIYRLVRERDVAYHAGVSKMPPSSSGGKAGRTDVNTFSIGIEMVGTEESGYTDKQYVTLNALLEDIEGRHKIKNIVGHDEIAPGRKTDPWQFDWSQIKK